MLTQWLALGFLAGRREEETVTPPVVTPPSVGATLGGYWPKMKTFADQRREQEEAQLIARNNAAIVALLF